MKYYSLLLFVFFIWKWRKKKYLQPTSVLNYSGFVPFMFPFFFSLWHFYFLSFLSLPVQQGFRQESQNWYFDQGVTFFRREETYLLWEIWCQCTPVYKVSTFRKPWWYWLVCFLLQADIVPWTKYIIPILLPLMVTLAIIPQITSQIQFACVGLVGSWHKKS